MSKKKIILPEIRFPEFVNGGEWVEKIIEDVAQITTGNKDTQDKVDDGKYPFYVRSQTIEKINSFSYDGEAILTSGDGVGVGKIYHYIIGKFDFHQRVYCIYKFDSEVKGKFVFYFFSKHFFNRVMQLNAKNSVDSVRRAMITEMPINLPPRIEEQQKITSCLSSLDELITAHNDKLDTLKEHKKALMQNLFPQEGQKVPNYRFPEFANDGVWVKKKLGDEDVSGFVNDKVDSQNLTLKNYISTNNMLPNYSGIADASKLPTTSRVTEFIEGDILISNIRPYLKKVWKSDKQGGASNDVLVFRSESSILSEFLECILKNDAFINYVMKSAKGVKMPRGDKDSMLKYSIRIPDRKEQQKIATCLSVLDKSIKAQSGKIDQLQQHKKGLMQGLFPKIES